MYICVHSFFALFLWKSFITIVQIWCDWCIGLHPIDCYVLVDLQHDGRVGPHLLCTPDFTLHVLKCVWAKSFISKHCVSTITRECWFRSFLFHTWMFSVSFEQSNKPSFLFLTNFSSSYKNVLLAVTYSTGDWAVSSKKRKHMSSLIIQCPCKSPDHQEPITHCIVPLDCNDSVWLWRGKPTEPVPLR